MEKPISVGDLVQVVRPKSCCGSMKSAGSIFRLEGMSTATGHCSDCRKVLSVPVGWKAKIFNQGIELSRLKRIPPLAELEGEKRDEEITA